MNTDLQPAVIAQYQQWLADAQLNVAVLTAERDTLAAEVARLSQAPEPAAS